MQIIQEAMKPASNAAKEEADPSGAELAELDDDESDTDVDTSEEFEPPIWVPPWATVIIYKYSN